MARIPGAGADVFDADGAVLLVPNLVQAVLIEQHRHVQRIARREREIAAEHGDVGGRRHGVVVRLHRVNDAFLHGAEQFAGGHQLIGVKQLNLHAVAGDLVEQFNRRVNHMGRQRRPGIGLHAPPDGVVAFRNRRRGQRRRRRAGRGRC